MTYFQLKTFNWTGEEQFVEVYDNKGEACHHFGRAMAAHEERGYRSVELYYFDDDHVQTIAKFNCAGLD